MLLACFLILAFETQQCAEFLLKLVGGAQNRLVSQQLIEHFFLLLAQVRFVLAKHCYETSLPADRGSRFAAEIQESIYHQTDNMEAVCYDDGIGEKALHNAAELRA